MDSLYWNLVESRVEFLESLLEDDEAENQNAHENEAGEADAGLRTNHVNSKMAETIASRFARIESDVEPLRNTFRRVFEDWDTIRVLWDRPGTESSLSTLPESSQIDYLMEWEPDLKRAVKQLQQLEELAPILDSPVWSEAPRCFAELYSLAERQQVQRQVVQDMTDRIDLLLSTYSAYVGAVSDLFSWYHATVRRIE